MAIVRPIEDTEGWDRWVAERPEAVRAMCQSHPPDRLYRIGSGHRVLIASYSEDGTVRVDVTGEYNRVVFSRQVFGVPIAELTKCDPPGPGEDVGDTSAEAGFTGDDVENVLIPKMRMLMGL